MGQRDGDLLPRAHRHRADRRGAAPDGDRRPARSATTTAASSRPTGSMPRQRCGAAGRPPRWSTPTGRSPIQRTIRTLQFFHCTRAWACFDLGRDPGDPPPPHPRGDAHGGRPEVEGVRLLHRGDTCRGGRGVRHRGAAVGAASTAAARCAAGGAPARRCDAPVTPRRPCSGSSMPRSVSQRLGMLPLLAGCTARCGRPGCAARHRAPAPPVTCSPAGSARCSGWSATG